MGDIYFYAALPYPTRAWMALDHVEIAVPGSACLFRLRAGVYANGGGAVRVFEGNGLGSLGFDLTSPSPAGVALEPARFVAKAASTQALAADLVARAILGFASATTTYSRPVLLMHYLETLDLVHEVEGTADALGLGQGLTVHEWHTEQLVEWRAGYDARARFIRHRTRY